MSLSWSEAREEMESWGGPVTVTPYGVAWGPLRLEPRSGIAGRTGTWLLRAPGIPDFVAIGPITSRRQLRRAVRRLISAALKLGFGLLELEELQEEPP